MKRAPSQFDFPEIDASGNRFALRLTGHLKSISDAVNETTDGYGSKTVSVTAAYVVQKPDVVVLANAAGGAFAVTMQSPAEAKHKVLHVRKTEGGANAVTLTPPSGTIDGAANLALTAAAPRARVACDGTNFFTV